MNAYQGPNSIKVFLIEVQATLTQNSVIDAGLLDFTDLLDTQSSLLNAQNAKVQNEGAIFSAWIELYRSAGGGFQGVETTQNLPLSTRTTSTNTINSHTTSADQGE